ncbi:MAG: hypothetical protein NTV22_07155 [bacterium]|nr:hypothetical protein [bacterium]
MQHATKIAFLGGIALVWLIYATGCDSGSQNSTTSHADTAGNRTSAVVATQVHETITADTDLSASNVNQTPSTPALSAPAPASIAVINGLVSNFTRPTGTARRISTAQVSQMAFAELADHVTAEPDNGWAVTYCAEYHFFNPTCDYAGLMTLLKDLLKRDLNDFQHCLVHGTIGRCLNKLGNYEEAIAYEDDVLRQSSREFVAQASEMLSAKMGSYLGLRARLRKHRADYSEDEYYTLLDGYDRKICECEGAIMPEGGEFAKADLQSNVNALRDRYNSLSGEQRAAFIRETEKKLQDKRLRYQTRRTYAAFMNSVHN